VTQTLTPRLRPVINGSVERFLEGLSVNCEAVSRQPGVEQVSARRRRAVDDRRGTTASAVARGSHSETVIIGGNSQRPVIAYDEHTGHGNTQLDETLAQPEADVILIAVIVAEQPRTVSLVSSV